MPKIVAAAIHSITNHHTLYKPPFDKPTQINTIHIRFIYTSNIIGIIIMGIVKISDQLHEELRKASSVMSRSINSQAEFWIKMGMLAELNPNLSFNQIMNDLMQSAQVSASNIAATDGVDCQEEALND